MRDLPPVTVTESEGAYHVGAGTWHYTLSKATGLIERAAARGDSWLAGPVPDLWASEAIDPRAESYHARHSPAAVRLVSADAARVVVESEGGFARVDGAPMPLVRRIRYTFDDDGVVRVDVSVQAHAPLVLRWLSLGKGEAERGSCRFLAYEGDAATGFTTCRPTCHALEDGDLDTGGRFVPWVQFGSDRGGLEILFQHSDRLAAGWTDTSPYPTGDPLGRAGDSMVVRAEAGRASWEAFALRNLRESVKEGWTWSDTFFLSVLPGKEPLPEANDLRVWWLGPHQYRGGWRAPDEPTAAAWAAAGANLVIGGANWRSGDYSNPERPEETTQFIELCHRYGMRVIPYLTFTDLEFGAPAFEAHGAEWRMEPVAEFNYRTHLMCYGAEGWQEHWEREVGAAWERFPFDGLYIDFWAGRLVCRNPRHGCTGPHGRCTAAGLRRMARFAAARVRERQGLIVANTNTLPLAMLNSCFDVRLLGEWVNPEEVDALSTRIFHNAHRYGSTNLLLVGRVPAIDEGSLAHAEAYQGTPVLSGGRTPDERDLLSRRARLMASFGTSRAAARNTYELPALPEGLQASLYHRQDNGEALLSISNPGSQDVSVPLGSLESVCGSLDKKMLLCVENAKAFVAHAPASDEDPRIEVPAGGLRTLWIRPDPGAPCVLYALTGRERPASEWVQKDRSLSFTVEHPSLSTAEVLIAGPAPLGIAAGSEELPFEQREGCVRATVLCNQPTVVSYPPMRLPQLRMRFVRFAGLPEITLPEGYEIRHYRAGDEAAWAEVLNASGSLGQWDVDRVIRLLQAERRAIPEGTFFVTWKGLPVATTTTMMGPGSAFPELSWVGVSPDHQGHRLAFTTCLAVLRYMRSRGVEETYLLTDDFRVPAIKTYLRLGFEPEVTHSSHPGRWQKILSEIG